ncbi:MAG: tRNA 5'-guanylyltransferase [Methanoregulaceae archaeon]|nr:tRNA 5'-guanylyltransferase [Methanoregulaceae archaeon]
MKHREIYSSLTCVPPVFLRIDGRGFHVMAEEWGLERPFDLRFSEAMERVSRELVADSGLSPDLAYCFSDEINLYFSHLPFGGRVEKLDSVSASYAASALTLAMDSRAVVSFDARIIQVSPELAVTYLADRQAEAWRNHLNAYGQETLMREGMTRPEAARVLKGMSSRELHELMFSHGVNLAKTPAWQRRGILVYKSGKQVEGYNPLLAKVVRTIRSAVVCEREPPVFSSPEGRSFLTGLVSSL